MQTIPRRGLAMRMNDQIRATTVRVVDMSGDDLGVLSREDALAAAKGEWLRSPEQLFLPTMCIHPLS